MLTRRMDRLGELNRYLKEHQMRLHDRFLLPLGYPYILTEDPEGMEEHYSISLRNRDSAAWPRWFYSFALTLQGKMGEARENLKPLFGSKDLVLRLMGLYLYTLTGTTAQEAEAVKAPKKTLASLLTPELLARLKKQADPLLFLVVSDLLDKSYQWLRADGEDATAP